MPDNDEISRKQSRLPPWPCRSVSECLVINTLTYLVDRHATAPAQNLLFHIPNSVKVGPCNSIGKRVHVTIAVNKIQNILAVLIQLFRIACLLWSYVLYKRAKMSLFNDLDFNFSNISDSDMLTASQLFDANLGSSLFAKPEFSDISDDDLIEATANAELVVNSVSNHNAEFSDISDAEFLKLPIEQTSSRFRDQMSSVELAGIVGEKFAKKTVDKSTWAVTLFGQWRADRNVRCMADNSIVYLDKPFGVMNDEELSYTVPLFLTEVRKADGSEYPPATLRDTFLHRNICTVFFCSHRSNVECTTPPLAIVVNWPCSAF